MADPILQAPGAIPPSSRLAEDLLDALKTDINAPAEARPAYRAMLGDLQRSSEKSVILENVRNLVRDLEPQVLGIIMRNLDLLEQRLQMTTEFEDLRGEIRELKIAVQSSTGPLAEPANDGATIPASSSETPKRDVRAAKPAPTPPYEEPAEPVKPKPEVKVDEKKNAKTEVSDKATATRQVDLQKPPQGIAESIGWTKLAPETRTTILAVAGAVGVTALVHYMVKFFRGTKKAVDVGVQKARSGIRTAVGWGALALTGMLAFFGFRYVNRIGNSIEEAKKMARAAEEKGKKIAEEGKIKLREVQNNAAKVEQAMRDQTLNTAQAAQDRREEEKQKNDKRNTALDTIPSFVSTTSDELKRTYGEAGYAFTSENNTFKIRRPTDLSNQEPLLLPVIVSSSGERVLKDHPEIVLRDVKDVLGALKDHYGLDLVHEHSKYLVERAWASALPSIAARMIVSFEQHPEVKWPENESPKNQREKIVTVINQLMLREDVKMEQVFSCMSAGKLDRIKLEKLYEPPTDADPEQRGSYLLAAELVVRSCVRHKEEIQRGYVASGEKEKGLWERITFRQFMGEFGHAFEAFEKLQHQIVEEKKIDPSAWDFDSVSNSVGKGKGQAAELTKLVLAEEEFSSWKGRGRELREILEDVSYAKILEYLQKKEISPEITVNGFENLIQTKRKLADDDVLGRALLAFCRHLPTPEQIEPFFHKVFPTAQYSLEDREANIAVIRGYLQDTMPMHQAVRFFMYQRMIEKGNPAGVVLMQAEIFRFIRQKEQGVFGEDYLKTRAHEAVQNLAQSVVSKDFFPALRKQFPSLDPRMQLRLQNTLERFGPAAFRTAAAAFLGPALMAVEPVIAFAKRNIERVTVVGGTVGSGTLFWLYRDFKLSRSIPQAVLNAVESRSGTDTLGAHMRAFLKLQVHPDAYTQLHHQLAGFVPKIVELRAIDGTIGEPLYEQLTRVFSNGSSQAELQKFHTSVASQTTAVEARVSTLKGLTSPTGAQIQELARCEKAVEQLHSARESLFTLANSTEKAAVEARNALRVFTAPIPTRIARFGPAVVHELLNLFIAAAENGPEFMALWRDVNIADLENKEALEGVLRMQRAGKAAEIGMRVSSGPLFYLMYARMGMGPAAVASLGAEGLISEAKFISGKIRENVEDIETSGDERTQQAFQGKLSAEETENKLIEYGSQSRTTAQQLRFWSASNFVTVDPKNWSFGDGDSDAEMTRERKLVRENYFSGYLMHRLLEKVDVRDPFAAQFLNQLYAHDGRESPRHTLLWGTYLQHCRQYLKEKTGSSDDLMLISKKMPLETALLEAENYAIFQMELRQYQSSFANIQLLEPQLLSTTEELEALNAQLEEGTLASEDYDKQAKPVQEKFAELNADFERDVKILSASEHFTITGKNGEQISLSDIALDDEGRPRFQYGKEGMILSEAYRRKKEELRMKQPHDAAEIPSVLLSGRDLVVKLDETNVPNQATYERMMQYANLLDQHPTCDPTGAVRNTLRNTPGLFWTRSLPEKHPYREVFLLMQETIRGNVAWLEARAAGLTTPDRTKTPSRNFEIGREEVIASLQPSRTQEDLHKAAEKFGLKRKPNTDGAYTRNGYGGFYTLQVDGTVLWSGGETPKSKKAGFEDHVLPSLTYIPRLDKWVEREPMERIANPDIGHTIHLRVDGEEYRVGTTETVETPIGLIRGETDEKGADTWYVKGAKAGSAYAFMRDYLGNEKPVQNIQIEDLPDIVLPFNPERKTYFFPYGSVEATIMLRDGKTITGKAIAQRNAISPMGGWSDVTQFFDAKFGVQDGYRDYVYSDQKWSLAPETAKREAKGVMLTIKNDRRTEIASIDLTSWDTRTRSYKHILNFAPVKQSPSEQKAVAGKERVIRPAKDDDAPPPNRAKTGVEIKS